MIMKNTENISAEELNKPHPDPKFAWMIWQVQKKNNIERKHIEISASGTMGIFLNCFHN